MKGLSELQLLSLRSDPARFRILGTPEVHGLLHRLLEAREIGRVGGRRRELNRQDFECDSHRVDLVNLLQIQRTNYIASRQDLLDVARLLQKPQGFSDRCATDTELARKLVLGKAFTHRDQRTADPECKGLKNLLSRRFCALRGRGEAHSVCPKSMVGCGYIRNNNVHPLYTALYPAMYTLTHPGSTFAIVAEYGSQT